MDTTFTCDKIGSRSIHFVAQRLRKGLCLREFTFSKRILILSLFCTCNNNNNNNNNKITSRQRLRD